MGLTTAALVVAAAAPSYEYLFENNDAKQDEQFRGHNSSSVLSSSSSVALCDWGWGGFLGFGRRGSSQATDKSSYNILKRKSQKIDRDDSANFQMMHDHVFFLP